MVATASEIGHTLFSLVVKLVDTIAVEAITERCEGSSPSETTLKSKYGTNNY
jgi:hypothetical protein